MRTFAPPIVAAFLLACASGEAPPNGDGDGIVDAGPGTDAIGQVCTKDPCSIYDQCGCESPQVCDLDFTDGEQLAMGGTACRDVTTPGMETATCTGFEYEQCAAGFVCLGSAAGTQCRKYCQTDNDCGIGGFCIIEPTSGGNPIPGIKVCTKSCDPADIKPAGCPSGYACGIFDNNGTGITDCIPTTPAGTDEVSCADGAAGDPCAPGFTCIIFSVNEVEQRRVCKQRCEFPGGACTAVAGQTCQDLNPGPTVGATEYGFCDEPAQ